MLEITADAQGQGTGKLVCLERCDVEHECEDTVSEQSKDNVRGKATFGGELGKASDLSSAVRVHEGLCGGKRRHAK